MLCIDKYLCYICIDTDYKKDKIRVIRFAKSLEKIITVKKCKTVRILNLINTKQYVNTFQLIRIKQMKQQIETFWNTGCCLFPFS